MSHAQAETVGCKTKVGINQHSGRRRRRDIHIRDSVAIDIDLDVPIRSRSIDDADLASRFREGRSADVVQRLSAGGLNSAKIDFVAVGVREIADRIGGCPVAAGIVGEEEDKPIGASAARHRVDACAPKKPVVSSSSAQNVVAIAPVKDIGARTADQRIVAVHAIKRRSSTRI